MLWLKVGVCREYIRVIQEYTRRRSGITQVYVRYNLGIANGCSGFGRGSLRVEGAQVVNLKRAIVNC
jgi:hypothetical protein